MRIALFLLALIAAPLVAAPVGTAFTYQGELRNSVSHAPVADGPYDFEFHLFDAGTLGSELAIQAKDDVTVAGGLFSVELDYTDVPFAASQNYWIEIRVRPGADTGVYQPLLPRQRITPTPYAINARGVQDGGVGTLALASGAVTADKIGMQQVGIAQIADGAVTTTKILDGTIGSADIDATQVQRRVAACGAGAAIQSVAADGAVTCQAAGAGNVTSVDTAGGLTGGPITANGTISIADGGVTSAKIADGTVASADVADGTLSGVDILDAGITASDLADNSVASGEIVNDSIAAIDLATGSVASSEIQDGAITTSDIGTGQVLSADILDGSITSLDVNSASVQLRVSQNCSGAIRQINADGTVICSAGSAAQPVQGSVSVNFGGDTSVIIGTDGLPLISTYANGDLAVVHCEDPACSTRTVSTIDTAANDVGSFNSIGIDGRGLGAVAYYDATAGDLKLALCADVACTSATVVTIDSTDDVGKHAAIGSDSGQRVVIAYFDETNDDLKIARCIDSFCTTRSTATVDASANDVGRELSLLTVNNFAMVAYNDGTTGALTLARCFTASTCLNGAAVISTVDAAAGTGAPTAMVMLADGNPAIVYRRGPDLYMARCASLYCDSFAGTGFALEAAVGTVSYLAATVDAVGRPLVAAVIAPDQLYVYRCFDELCAGTDAAQSVFAAGAAPGAFDARPSMALGYHGFPVMTSRFGSTTTILVCDNHSCNAGARQR